MTPARRQHGPVNCVAGLRSFADVSDRTRCQPDGGGAHMIIETIQLRKSFRHRVGREMRSVEAVAGLDLIVKEGEIFGFLGPNGAGKTTTLRMLATLMRPDSGEAMVAGADLWRDPAEVRR